jgi:hypothetical protein
MPSITQPQPSDITTRLLQRIAALEARIATLETNSGVPFFSGVPDPSVGQIGSLGITSEPRLWVRTDPAITGSGWSYVNLTPV